MLFALGWRIGALILFALTLGGCNPTPPEHLPEGVIRIYTGMERAEVQEFHLSDGTRCVAIVNYRGTGITCDWEPDVVVNGR